MIAACHYGHLQVVKLLLIKGAAVNHHNKVSIIIMVILHTTCAFNFIYDLKALCYDIRPMFNNYLSHVTKPYALRMKSNTVF